MIKRSVTMAVKTGNIMVQTHGNTDIHDITRELVTLVEQSGLRNGTLTVFCPSSTSGLTPVEYEPGAITDLFGLS
jgi:thiamine phosphate synthase YjbQ (UPF0047 family)